MDYSIRKNGNIYSYATTAQEGGDMVKRENTALTQPMKDSVDAYIKRRFGGIPRKKDFSCCICVDAGKIKAILNGLDKSDKFRKEVFVDMEENCPISVEDIATLDAAKVETRRFTIPV